MANPIPSSGLVRSLSLLDVVMVGIAAMIGGAIFVLVGPAMNDAGPALIIVFLLNGIMTLFTAMTYAELGSALPEAGGGYSWIRMGLPRPNAFLSGWMAWFAHIIAGSLYAVAFGSFLQHLLFSFGFEFVNLFAFDKLVAAAGIVVFTYVNMKGASDTGKVGNIITFSQIAIITILIAAGIIAMIFSNPNWESNFSDFLPNGSLGLIMAMGLTFIAFEGYEIIVQTGEEVKNPKKNIPKAIFISLAVVITIYIIFTFVFIGGINPEDVGQDSWKFIGGFGEVGVAEGAKHLLPYGVLIVLVGGIVSTLSALNATTFSSSRVAFAMGRQYNLPIKFSSIHPKHRTPHFSAVASGAVMLIVALALPLEQIALVASLMFLFLFTQVNIASITIRKLYGDKLDYGFKIPFFPLVPIIGIITQVGLAIFLLIFNPLSWVIAIAWILIGFSVYKLYSIKKEIEHHSPLITSKAPKERKEYRVMVIYKENSIEYLSKIAMAIAGDKEGEVIFLNIVNVPIQLPLSSSYEIIEPQSKQFENFKSKISDNENHVYLLRITHDQTEAILASVEEQGVNLLLMDFETLRQNRKLLSLTTCDIVGARVGPSFEDDVKNIVVSYDKGRHSNLALILANSISKFFGSNIRIIRALVSSPEEERDILARINETMFDLDLKKIPVERIQTDSNNMIKDLQANIGNSPEIIMLGAGNQSEQAFSPKTIELLEKNSNTVFVVRNSRLSEIQVRYFWSIISARLRENRHIYRLYLVIFGSIRSAFYKKQIPQLEDDYFSNTSKK